MKKGYARFLIAILVACATLCAACGSSASSSNATVIAQGVLERVREPDGDDATEMAVSEAIEETTSTVSEPEEEETGPDIAQAVITQYDISDYPRIKLYLDVVNSAGEVVEGLTDKDVVISCGREAGGQLAALTVEKLVMLDKNEGISIGLIADVSGSMEGNMSSLRSVMTQFIDAIQFENDDAVELVQFSSQAYICNSFTNDAAAIKNSISNLTADGTTRLYDTLMNEIVRIRAQQNSKCVIGFSDGWDNESAATYEEVAAYAERCGVPVYLVGIGSDVDEVGLAEICTRSGGSYHRIDEIDALIDMYQSIYRDSKQLYCLEYTVPDGDDFSSSVFTTVSFPLKQTSGTSAGSAEQTDGTSVAATDADGRTMQLTFEPKEFFENLYTRFLIAGEDCQTKGERNLLDSGLIVTSDEAYQNPEAVAYQSQKAIESGGTGSSRADIYIVLVESEMIDLQKDGDDYILYGRSQYNISKTVTYGDMREPNALRAVKDKYGSNVSASQKLWLEDNRDNYEKIRIVRDKDGAWRIYTRTYERKDGGDAVVVNAVHDVRKIDG